MKFFIDPTSNTPLNQQIASQIRAALARGEMNEGDRFPSARELAESLKVNMHTVLRAFRTLRDEGLLQVRRGRGVTVLGTAGHRARLVELAQALLNEARKQGMDMEQVKAMLEETT